MIATVLSVLISIGASWVFFWFSSRELRKEMETLTIKITHLARLIDSKEGEYSPNIKNGKLEGLYANLSTVESANAQDIVDATVIKGGITNE